ncbi:MAG: HAMP domain-containing sensor histidine kinase [Gemmatimonadaceae bacterium]
MPDRRDAAVRSIRASLTNAYATALILTVVACALVLVTLRQEGLRAELRQTVLFEQLQQRVMSIADQVVRAITVARSTGTEPVVAQEGRLTVPRMSQRMEAFLSVVDGYVLVQDSTGYDIYASAMVRAMSTEARDQFSAAARQSVNGRPPAVIWTADDRIMLAAREVPLSPNARYRVFAGLSASTASGSTGQDFTLLWLIPLLVAVSIFFAWTIAGRSFRPIERLVDQVEAITDGRSLHRRLNLGAAGIELGRLATTLNEMIERLETSFGGLRRFTADASHELKTPLAVMRADIERAMTTGSSTERAIALEEALEQVTRMADLVDSLLTLARADEGRFEVYREPVQAGPLVREVVETARLLAEEAELTIDAPVIEEADVLGDLPRLRQLMLNLVTNAIKYTPKGGRVTIGLTRGEEVVTFSVEDSGIGIAAADLPHVFERFWRADRVRSRGSERGGFGLGLAISHWIALAHGGHLSVQSRLGRGSTFSVVLPLAGAPGSGMTGEYPVIDSPEAIPGLLGTDRGGAPPLYAD